MQQTNGFLSECVNIIVFKLPCVLKLVPDFYNCEVYHQYKSSYEF
jgi:hypothetical protein